MSHDSLAFKLHPNDNVALARNAIAKGTVLAEFADLLVTADVPAAHKVALAPVALGERPCANPPPGWVSAK